MYEILQDMNSNSIQYINIDKLIKQDQEFKEKIEIKDINK